MSDKFWDDDALPIKASSFWDEPEQTFTDGAKAAAGGLAQGASLGFADEIGAASTAAMNAITGITGPLSGQGLDSIADDYAQNRNALRKDFAAAQEASPIVGTAASVIGSLPTAGLFSAAKGASMAARAGVSALGGAVSGVGQSDAESLGNLASDAAIGGALGGALSSGGDKAVEGLKFLGKGASDRSKLIADYLLKKGGKIAANVPEDVTERYLQRSAQVNAALPTEELTDHILDPNGGVLSQLQSKLSAADASAWERLSSNPSIDPRAIRDQALEHVDEILGGRKGDLNRTAGIGASADKVKAIGGVTDQLEEAYRGGSLSESDLKSIVQDLQKKAYTEAGSPRSSIAAEGLRTLSGKLNSGLKGMNPSYADAMIPVEDMTRTLKSAESLFVNQANPAASTDKAARVINRFRNPKNQFAQDTVAKLDEFTGGSLSDDIKDSLAKEAFTKADTAGSRKTLLGTIAGRAIGGGLGGAAGYAAGDELGAGAGAVAGFGADKYAGQAFKALLDGRLKGGQAVSFLSQNMGKFAQPLIEATKRGNQAVAATHFLLMQSQPEYRKKISESEE